MQRLVKGKGEARVAIDLSDEVGEINRNVYGHFIEHLGKCIYGGIWKEGDLDRGVVDLIKGLDPPILRWPGGNFASGYHWIDGIGPSEERKPKFDLAWRAIDPNAFGTNEFIKLCRILQAEPYICVNMGSGTAEEAANWVEYCNGPAGSYHADLRVRGGEAQPFGVRFWGLGNEVYGDWQIGHCDAATYAKQALEFAKRMRWVDPAIKTVAVGCDDPQWNWEVLRTCKDQIDYISLHKYYYNPDYYERVAAPLEAERSLARLAATILAATGERRVKIAFDEWNLWHPEAKLENGLNQSPVLADAIFAAGIFNAMHRLCPDVHIACFAQLVNVLPLIISDDKGARATPPYLAFQLYGRHAGSTAVRVRTACETYESKAWGQMRVPILDVSATLDKASRTVSIFILNRDVDREVECDVSAIGLERGGKAELYELNGSGVEKPDAKVSRGHIGLSERFSYTAPPHSLTVIKQAIAG
ncbi:MAG: alpha-N-arabinofuranosidase [Candidatus Brockarchaeota archaeon]|nr:alpha-N-arabinofuranosidase [Candidatus Brockarchaeota archaeon]